MRLVRLRTQLASLIAGKSWRSAWARSDDTAGGGGRAELSRPYALSPWVLRAVSLITAPVAALPVKFLGADDQEITDPDRADWWSKPALTAGGRMTRGQFVEASHVSLNLWGECFWLMDDTWLARRGERAPLIIARPDRMRHVVRGGELLGWEFTDGAGARHSFLPQDVVQTKFFNPYDEFRGLAPLEAARIAADADYAGALFSKHLAQSNGDRGVYVIAKDGQISEDQQKQIEASLRQKREMNQRGVYKSSFLTGNVTIEDPKIQAADAAFVASRMENRKEIFAAFGVPVNMADKTESTAVGGASDRYRLREDCCVPQSMRLAESIAIVEQRRSGVALEVQFDWSQDGVMQQVRNERAAAACVMHARGVPWSELNEFFSLGLPEFPGSKTAWLPLNLQAAADEPKTPETKPAAQPAPDAGTPPADAPQKLARAVSALESLINQRAARASSKESDRDKLWRHHQAAQAASVKLWRAQIGKALAEARRETLANLGASDKVLQAKSRRGLLNIIFDLTKFTARLTMLAAAAARETFAAAEVLFNDDYGFTDDPWTMPEPEVIAAVREREPFIADAAREIRDAVGAEVEAGLQAGESTDQIAERVRGAFNAADKERATTIARTETAIAFSTAHLRGMKAKGILYKEWLTARDEQVRASHMKLDGVVVGVNDDFDLGNGVHMPCPCAQHAPAGEVINCRCVLIASRGPATQPAS